MPAESPQSDSGDIASPSARALGVLLVLATAALLRVGLGYRPVPSIDDFAYLPAFRHLADPASYSRDALLQSMSLHSVGWYAVFRAAAATTGVTAGFWLATLALSVATVAGLARLAAALGASRAFLPLVTLLACASSLHGVGRGQLDGLFGNGLHGQWMGLVALLFAYDAFVRERAARSGVFLGIAALAHLSVAMHGAFVLGLAVLVTPGPRWRNLATAAALSALIALPAIVPALSHLSGAAVEAWPASRLIEEGYRFRLAHEYDFGLTRTGWLGATLLMCAGAGGALLSRSSRPDAPTGRVLALALGHVVLVAAAALMYGPLADAALLPYLLSLTRTSPLLVALVAVLIVGGLSHHLGRAAGHDAPFQLLLAVATALAVLMELRLFVEWNAALVALLALGAAVALAGRRDGLRRLAVVAVLAAVTAVAGGQLRRFDRVEAVPSPEAAQLYAWIRRQTPPGAVFVVPPGLEEFRWYAERSVYVDFKSFPPASARAIAAWRDRLDDVAAPDRAARAAHGWDAAREFDRCYAARNTPARIAALLTRSGADYFVWDADGLRIPPQTGSDRTAVPGLGEVFRNARFVVYRASAGSGGGDA